MKKVLMLLFSLSICNVLTSQDMYEKFYNYNINPALQGFIPLVELSEEKPLDDNDSLYYYYVVYINFKDSIYLDEDYNIINLSDKANLADIYEKIYYQTNVNNRKIFIAFSDENDTSFINKFNFLPKISPLDEINIQTPPIGKRFSNWFYFFENIRGKVHKTFYNCIQGLTKEKYYKTLYPILTEESNTGIFAGMKVIPKKDRMIIE